MDRHAITERYRSPSVNQDVTFCHHAGQARCVRENGEALSQGFGRVALVSSGSRGIGAATVRRLAAAGWDISFCHHGDEQAAVETEKAASELGARVLAVQADLTAAAANDPGAADRPPVGGAAAAPAAAAPAPAPQ